MPDRKNKTRRPGVLTPEDAALFRSVMKAATPISPDRVAPLAETGEPVPEVKKVLRARPLPTAPAVSPAPRSTTILPELRAGVPVSVDARTMDRLRRGQLRPQARLDLHGMTQDRALEALRGFILDARRADKRCVIVITGKGGVSTGGGVLRRETPRWLNLPPIRAAVLGYAEAQPKDGGSGAIYVLLKRRGRT